MIDRTSKSFKNDHKHNDCRGTETDCDDKMMMLLTVTTIVMRINQSIHQSVNQLIKTCMAPFVASESDDDAAELSKFSVIINSN